MVFLSIIIPCYNGSKTIIPLISSIFSSKKITFEEVEILLVDDKSTDQTLELLGRYILKLAPGKQKQIRIISLKTNQGPARARNIGVKYAKGSVVLFLDADVVLYKDTLSEIVKCFKNDPDLYALTGVWDKRQKTKKFFPKFKALRDWSYWINERDPSHYYYLFSTRIAAIDRKLFLRLGGFDETYKAALVEDIELTYRISKRYAVIFNSNVKVHHEFEDFMPVAKKYFWRSYYWSRIYRERKKFDPVATTSKEAFTTLSAAGLVGMLSAFFIVRIMKYEVRIMNYALFEILLFISLFMLLVHLWGVRKFLLFALKEEGFIFAIKSFVTGIILYLIILAGAAYSLMRK